MFEWFRLVGLIRRVFGQLGDFLSVPVSLARWCWCAPLVFLERFLATRWTQCRHAVPILFLIRHGTSDTPILGVWSGSRSGLRYRLEGICIDSNFIFYFHM